MINKEVKALIISTSTIYGSDFLEYIREEIKDFTQTDELIFIPFAQPSGINYDDYTEKVKNALQAHEIKVRGIHEFENKKEAIRDAKTIFVGGGNTFLLLKTLYELDLMTTLREAILSGTPYIGTSAGSNLTGQTIGTTNDMPIVYPPSFEALKILPFNLNPHYLEADPNSTHKGETREQRIAEFLIQNDIAVLGLKEGSWLEILEGEITLKGSENAVWFSRKNKERIIESGMRMSSLLQ
ncbi:MULTISPECIES: dipeptidase PepE [Weeksella]|uniref:Dipeptidase E n=1 Tax=Weeksella virosa (strain ATCC 43766 / DSM 16922 / JCM 21250 / CCUG 30538 / CDC 9751 / IAM 14551 / NBRC 16016 / NCTC 11634 / CL345/78) TaxID=865938 RepID=F0NZU6_WEEVC|nr:MULTISPECIES: dipeptidase PepE [Weeksella]ADX68370.1 Dipeptidase E [Weeksella virosa DSM 16922]MDK7375752.1 dipeptidase PepE [Weeksella virosa]MDK7674671.1 dipeptidase PepE [Weeksella virosa]OFM83154.1 dipeptidase E [Weeksella sp. HMSC059D05]SUP54690.1 Peptidase E [Weeksella virosa]